MGNVPRLRALWDGEAFVVRENQRQLADQHYVIGEHYWITEHEERSMKSHDHYFVAITKAWENLPEEWSFRFGTPEHLRKYVLIRCGYREERTRVYPTAAEAQRASLLIRDIDDFLVTHVEGTLLTIWKAKSQDKRHMRGSEFQESKTAVLNYLCEKLGIDPEVLKSNAHHTT